jgi:hypothetical protein
MGGVSDRRESTERGETRGHPEASPGVWGRMGVLGGFQVFTPLIGEPCDSLLVFLMSFSPEGGIPTDVTQSITLQGSGAICLQRPNLLDQAATLTVKSRLSAGLQ